MLRIRKTIDNIEVFACWYVTQREGVTYESSGRWVQGRTPLRKVFRRPWVRSSAVSVAVLTPLKNSVTWGSSGSTPNMTPCQAC